MFPCAKFFNQNQINLISDSNSVLYMNTKSDPIIMHIYMHQAFNQNKLF